MKKKLATLLTVSVCLVGYFVVNASSDEREIDELRERVEATLREAKMHSAKGHVDEARELMKRANAMRFEADELAKHHEQREHRERRLNEEHQGQADHERHQGGQEQIEHIHQAAVHLHLAGMHEPAEELIREAERRRHELEREREGDHEEVLHRHVEELAKHVHELHERLERMERAILEMSDRGNPRSPSDAR